MTSETHFLQSENLILRSLEREDLTEEYLQWLNDEEVCRYNSHAVFPNSFFKMQNYFDSIQGNNSTIVMAIISKDQDKHIGNISLQSINWINRSAEFAILLGDKEYWGKGVATEAVQLIMEYGFSRLNLHRICCGTSAENKGMQKVAAKLNMTEEGVRKEALFKDGKYVDIIEYGILKKDFKG